MKPLIKTKPIIADPLTFMRAGLVTLSQAVVLVHVGRTGLQGARVETICDGTGLNYNTIYAIFNKLLDLGLVTRFSRSNAQGRAFFWACTVKGWSVLTTAPEVELFPDALVAPTQKGGKHA